MTIYITVVLTPGRGDLEQWEIPADGWRAALEHVRALRADYGKAVRFVFHRFG